MEKSTDPQLTSVLSRVALAQSHEEEEELGRGELASVIFHASPEFLDKLLKAAKRDNRLRRCLAAARYYSGLSQAKCDKIDAVLQAPFQAPRRRR